MLVILITTSGKIWLGGSKEGNWTFFLTVRLFGVDWYNRKFLTKLILPFNFSCLTYTEKRGGLFQCFAFLTLRTFESEAQKVLLILRARFSFFFRRALCVYCWSYCMISQNSFVITTMGSVMWSHPTVSSWGIWFWVPSHVTWDFQILSLLTLR